MNVILFGATGMVGQGVLRECLLDPDVSTVLSVGRNSSGKTSPKLRDIVHADLMDLSPIENLLTGFDAGFFCVGISSVGMSEADYRRVTFDMTLAAAKTLARLSPNMTFIYVSAAGADSTERGRIMWARVRGHLENRLLTLPFKNVFVFRPAVIVPLHGITSKTRLYRALYTATRPVWPLLRAAFPQYVTTTEQMGRAMLRAARSGAPKRVLETRDINALR